MKYQIENQKINSNVTKKFITVKDFYEDLSEEIKSKISLSYLYNAWLKHGFCSPYTTHKIKRIARNISNLKINDSKISNSEKLIYKANILLIENTKKLSIYSNKNQNYKFGEIIEVDACQDRFFGTNEKIHIYHAIDAKSGALVALWAEKEETNKGYQKLLEILFQNYGLPETIISDKRRTMWGNEFTETAFKKSLNSKNINLFTTSNPKGKPNVEHSFKNAQRSYPYYFSKQNINIKSIKDIQENQLKITKFYNEKYKRNTVWKDSSFRVPNNPNSFKMDLIIDRKINAGVVQYNNKYYCPFDEHENRVGMKEGGFIQLCLDSNGDLKIYRKWQEIWC